MGFRFRKTIKLLPGVRLNIGKKSGSLTLGPNGACVNIGKNGTRLTIGAPGTGLSYTKKLGKKGGNNTSPPSEKSYPAWQYAFAFAIIAALVLFIALCHK